MTGTTRPARVRLDQQRDRGPLDPRLFGSFVEHMGRCVYTGIYEPGHPSADEHGFRRDVAELVGELGPTLVRYPGGNFVSGYHWEDGIGPREERPRRLDLAWRSIESNQVGTDDFLAWAERNRLTPMMAVNLGTRGIQAAADLVEYCNLPSGTHWSDLRRHHGREQPYGVGLWCLGNEMDGPWQIGHRSAAEYGQLAAEAGKAMKLVDPTIELVACGSSNHTMPTFGYWESEVLEHAWDVVDHISMHAYYEERDGDRRSFLASGADMDAFIDGVVATIDAVAARKHSSKRIGIAFDEWNVWYQSRFNDEGLPQITEAGRLLEDDYSALDAVVVGDLLISLLNHADRVRIACQAQLVNVIAPIRTEPGGAAWRQPTFHPFAAVAAAARGVVLAAEVDCATLPTDRYGEVPTVTAAATHDPDTGAWSVFLTNRSPAPTETCLDLRGLTAEVAPSARSLTAGDPAGSNAVLTATDLSYGSGDTLSLVLPPESWTVVEARPGARLG
ncbi:alpha-N-arabinofuranosidase [Nocardioides sp. NBC_00368]|uniref:arabinosylfuranosidase ArfA n=1 Tax=Nocardioides sp. NBC_00368 TaxID=2976000 RepID=UPI002E1B9DDC